MTDDELPPLPAYLPGLFQEYEVFNTSHIRAYGRDCADAAIERCIAFLNAEQEDTQMHNYAAVYANKLRSLKGKP